MELKLFEGVKILYYGDYWDGPVAGLCVYEGVYYYYFMSKEEELLNENSDDENDIWSDRDFYIYELTFRELANELYWHSLFCTNVKAYSDADSMLVFDYLNTNENFWDKMKQENTEKFDYKSKTPIGYFVGINYYKNENS